MQDSVLIARALFFLTARNSSQYTHLRLQVPKYKSIMPHSIITKRTIALQFAIFYHASWNINYLAISSSTYFFTAFSATVLSSFAIGTVFISSYSAWGSWISKIYTNISKSYLNLVTTRILISLKKYFYPN